jgi:CRP/FNR family cyclic AMP-dependent transcriptional regulator
MLDRSVACEVMRHCGWLATTPTAFADSVIARSSVHAFDRGEWVYRHGEESGGLWGVADGGILVEFSDGVEAPRFAVFASVGFWTGEGTVLAGGQRHVGLRTTRPTQMIHLARKDFMTIVNEDAEAWRWVGVLTLSHMVSIIGLREDLSLRSPAARVLATLLRMTDTTWAGPPPRDRGSILIDFSQEEMADLCNVSRSYLARILGGLRRDGLLALGYRQIEIRDVGGLRRRLNLSRE